MGTSGVMTKRLIVIADSSLTVEAITIGLRKSGGFTVLGHVGTSIDQMAAIVRAEPEVVLVDDMGCSLQTVELIREIKRRLAPVVAIVLATSMAADWLEVLFDAGAAGAISKATHPAVLATLVRETIDGHVVNVQKAPPATRRHVVAASTGTDSALTKRELEVLQLLASGSTNGEIARMLWVTEQTVKFHLSNVYRKLHVGNRTEASNFAHMNGLVEAVQV